MNRTEKKAKEILEGQYAHVQGPMPRAKWTENDHFGLFDFIVFSKDKGALVQVSTKYLSQRPKCWQARFTEFECPSNIKKQYWRWDKKRKKFIIDEYE